MYDVYLRMIGPKKKVNYLVKKKTIHSGYHILEETS